MPPKVAEVAKDIEKEERDESAAPPGAVEVEVGGDEDEDEEDSEPAAAGAEGEAATRRERRRERGRFKQQYEEERAARERDNREWQDRFSRLEQRVSQPQQTQQQPKEDDEPEVAQLQTVRDQIQLLTDRWHLLKPEQQQAQRNDFMSKMRGYQDRETDLVLDLREKRRAKASAPSPELQARQAEFDYIKTNYGDVVTHPAAWAYAQNAYGMARALGKPHHFDTLAQVMKETRRQFKLGNYGSPDPSMSRKLSGVPASGGSGGSRPRRKVVLDPVLQKMANAKYKHIQDEKERFRLFAKNEMAEDDERH